MNIDEPLFLIITKALASQTRLNILKYIGHRTVPEAELVKALHCARPTIRNHCEQLELAGIIEVTIKDKKKHVRLIQSQLLFSLISHSSDS